jgi:hypothetical protein
MISRSIPGNTNRIGIGTSLLAAAGLLLSGYVQAKDPWNFESGDRYCEIETLVKPDNNNVYEPKAITLTIIYMKPSATAHQCEDALEHNSVIALVTTQQYTSFLEGSHAMLQSDGLLNEQVPMVYYGNRCIIKSSYTLDYRVSNLLITELFSQEDIRLTTHLESSGSITGSVSTDGFDSVFQKFTECVDALE